MDESCLTAFSAVMSGNTEVLKAFLDEGKNWTVADEKGWRLIHFAAYDGHIKCVKLILDKAKSDYQSFTEIEENVLLPTAEYWETPISLAAIGGHCDVVEMLADLYLRSELSYEKMGYPLHVACGFGQDKCIEILAKKMPQFLDVNDDTEAKNCPIHITVEKGNIEGAEILIQNGCDVNSKCDSNQTPLHLAVSNDSYEMVKLFTDKVGDINALDVDGYTPLFLASTIGNVDIVRYLIDHGGDASIPSSHGGLSHYFPIDTAAENGHFDIVKVLADYTPRNSAKYAIAHVAVHGNNDCLMYLFDKGFSTFDSKTNMFGKNAWLIILSGCPKNILPKTVKTLLDKETLFHKLAKLNELRLRFATTWYDIYFLSHTFAVMNSEVLIQFLNAGILELRFDCKSLPNIDRIIDKHVKFPDSGNLIRNVSGILTCLKYFPFLTWSHKDPSVIPTQDNFGEGNLIQTVPSLQNLTRWTIRCLIIKNKGMIHRKYVESLRLPKLVTEFLVKC